MHHRRTPALARSSIRIGVEAGVVAALLAPGPARAQSERVPMFRAPMVIPSHSGATWAGRPYGLAAHDFLDATGAAGQDGLPELVVVNGGVDLLSCEPAAWGLISVFWNTGEWGPGGPGLELVQEISILPGLGVEVVIADLDGQSGPDILVSATQWVAGWPDSGIYIAMNDGTGAFLPAAKNTMPLGIKGLAVGDLDGDGLGDDAVVATTGCPIPEGTPLDFLWVKVGNDAGRFDEQVPVHLNIPGDLAPSDLLLADFIEGSGLAFPDFLATCAAAESLWVVENLGNWEFRTRALHKPGDCDASWAITSAAGGTLDGDSHPDFAGVSGLDALIFLGDGRGGFTSSCDDARLRSRLVTDDEGPPAMAHGIALGQLNNTGGADIAVTIRNLVVRRPQAAVLLGRGDGTFEAPSPTHAYLYSVDGDAEDPDDVVAPLKVVIADMDGSGSGDMVTTNHRSDTLSILLNTMSSVSRR